MMTFPMLRLVQLEARSNEADAAYKTVVREAEAR